MRDQSELLARTRPLADPVRIITFLCLASTTIFGIEGAIAIQRASMIGAIIPLSMALLLVSLAFLIGTFGKPNAIYLRAFRTDKSTFKLRAELAAILGPDYRLSGIRPPREKTSIFMRFFMPGIMALRYAGSKFMELEAGDDWMARLWKTYQSIRLVFIDVRETTPHVHHEIQMTLAAMGVERCLFIVDPRKSDEEWRATIAEVAGAEYDAAQFQLLHAGLKGAEWDRMASELNAMVKTLPAGVPGQTDRGRQFILDNVSEKDLRKSARPSPMILITAIAALAISLSLFGLLTGGIAGLIGLALVLLLVVMVVRELILAVLRARREGQLKSMLPSPGIVTFAIAVLVLAAIYALRLRLSIGEIIVIFLGLVLLAMIARAMVVAVMRFKRLAHAGHRAAAVKGSILLAIIEIPMLCAMLLFLALPIMPFLRPILMKSRQRAVDSSVLLSLHTLYVAEVTYQSTYPEQGYTCRLSDLGGDPASGAAPTAQAAQLIDSQLAAGQRNGYTFAISNCATLTSGNSQMVTSFQLTAVPTDGRSPGYCSDDSGDIRRDPSGGKNCTQPLTDPMNQ